ncbi:hypothetical protein KM043_014512 [Ampulex compressa]|nr:hypothetical protein KM043_014512 [Ampulex compressa]
MSLQRKVSETPSRSPMKNIEEEFPKRIHYGERNVMESSKVAEDAGHDYNLRRSSKKRADGEGYPVLERDTILKRTERKVRLNEEYRATLIPVELEDTEESNVANNQVVDGEVQVVGEINETARGQTVGLKSQRTMRDEAEVVEDKFVNLGQIIGTASRRHSRSKSRRNNRIQIPGNEPTNLTRDNAKPNEYYSNLKSRKRTRDGVQVSGERRKKDIANREKNNATPIARNSLTKSRKRTRDKTRSPQSNRRLTDLRGNNSSPSNRSFESKSRKETHDRSMKERQNYTSRAANIRSMKDESPSRWTIKLLNTTKHESVDREPPLPNYEKSVEEASQRKNRVKPCQESVQTIIDKALTVTTRSKTEYVRRLIDRIYGSIEEEKKDLDHRATTSTCSRKIEAVDRHNESHIEGVTSMSRVENKTFEVSNDSSNKKTGKNCDIRVDALENFIGGEDDYQERKVSDETERNWNIRAKTSMSSGIKESIYNKVKLSNDSSPGPFPDHPHILENIATPLGCIMGTRVQRGSVIPEEKSVAEGCKSVEGTLCNLSASAARSTSLADETASRSADDPSSCHDDRACSCEHEKGSRSLKRRRSRASSAENREEASRADGPEAKRAKREENWSKKYERTFVFGTRNSIDAFSPVRTKIDVPGQDDRETSSPETTKSGPGTEKRCIFTIRPSCASRE